MLAGHFNHTTTVNALLSNGASGKDNHWLDDPELIHFNIFIQYNDFCKIPFADHTVNNVAGKKRDPLTALVNALLSNGASIWQ